MKTDIHLPETGLPIAVMSPNVQSPERLPVVVYLHGAEDRGDDGTAPLRGGLASAIRASPREWPAAVVFPQCPVGDSWTGDTLLAAERALEAAVRRYGLRRGQAAITGVGIGGTGVWEAAIRWPHLWRRAMPVGAHTVTRAAPRAESVPMWIHHGADDEVVPAVEARGLARRLFRTSQHLRYDEHAGAGHDVADRVYGSREVAAWLCDSHRSEVDRGPIQAVFIGGTGRCGTTTMSSILVRHHDFVRTPEIRIHGREGGLFDVLAGHTTPEQLVEAAQRHWFYRWWPGVAPVGVHRIVDEPTWTEALRRYRTRFADEPFQVTADLMRTVLDPVARSAGAAGWVEHSPLNGRYADTLYRLFPDLKMIHPVRDGRDVAVSMTHQTWGPESAEDGVREWADRLRDVWVSTRALPAGQLLEVRWEEFVDTDREAQLARVLDFVGIGESPSMREFFDTRVSSANAHSGRWRTELPDAEADRVDKVYREIYAELVDEGVGCLPAPPG